MPSERSRLPKVLRLSRILHAICNDRPSRAIFSIGKVTPLPYRRGVLASSTIIRSPPGSVWLPLPPENPDSNAAPAVGLPWHMACHLFCNMPCPDGSAPRDYRGFSQHSL